MNPMTLDRARREDVARALDFANWAAQHTTANFALEPEPLDMWLADFDRNEAMYPWLVARSNEAVVGFAKGGPHRLRGAYAWTAEVTVYVDPDHHRQGIASALYRVLLSVMRDQGYVTLLAGITTPHAASEALHASFGFRRCATFHRAGWKFDAWHDVSYWELFMQPADASPAPLRSVSAVWK